jgi:uncharacterized protein YkwD
MHLFILLLAFFLISGCANEESYRVAPSMDQALVIPTFNPNLDMMTPINTPTDFTLSSDLGMSNSDPQDLVLEADSRVVETDIDSGADADSGVDVNTTSSPIYAQDMLRLVNEFRLEGGICGSDQMPAVPPLELNLLLNQSSLAHADDMAMRNYFSHDSPEGVSARTRINQAGYGGSGWGENIAAGRGTADETFQQWKNSPGHCRNMLSPVFLHLGVGYANNSNAQFRHYWVQNFGRP